MLAEGYRAEIFRVILLSAVTEELSLERLSLRAVMKTIAEHDVTEFVAKVRCSERASERHTRAHMHIKRERQRRRQRQRQRQRQRDPPASALSIFC